VRGRSRVLRINYRTTEQIQRVADRVLGASSDDLDEGTESRRGTVSLLRGPDPVLKGFARESDERAFAVETVKRLVTSGLSAGEIAVFARTWKLAESFSKAIGDSGVSVHLAKEDVEQDDESASAVWLGTMHRAKGLEFKAVLVVGCDDKKLPSAHVLAQQTDADDRTATIERERRLLYVSLTRARDEAFVTWSEAPSPFVAELLAVTGTKS